MNNHMMFKRWVRCLLPMTLLCAAHQSAYAGDLTQWTYAVTGDSPTFAATNVTPLPKDINIGTLSGDITYEFIVNGSPFNESETLMGRDGDGQSEAIKFAQFKNTNDYGVTQFRVADYSFGVATTYGSDVVLDFVADSASNTTSLFVNGVDTGATVPLALSLYGTVGIGADDGIGGYGDNYDGAILGVATFDYALSASQVSSHFNAYNDADDAPEPASLVLFSLPAIGLYIGLPKRCRYADRENAPTATLHPD